MENIGVMLLFVFVFLGSFVILVNFVPNEMVTATQTIPKNYESYETSIKTWHGTDIGQYSNTWNDTVTTDYSYTLYIGGRRIDIDARYVLIPYSEGFRINYRYGLFNLYLDTGHWYSQNGTKIDHDYWTFTGYAAEIYGIDLDNEYSQFKDISLTVKFDIEAKFQIDLVFDFNITAYDTPREAWLNDDLRLMVGITLDNENTSLSAWDIVAKLLTFQTLEVFGDSGVVSIVLNAILALPIWASVVYISFVIAMEILDRIIPL